MKTLQKSDSIGLHDNKGKLNKNECLLRNLKKVLLYSPLSSTFQNQ